MQVIFGIWNFKCCIFHFNNYVGLSIEIKVNGTATTRTQFWLERC